MAGSSKKTYKTKLSSDSASRGGRSNDGADSAASSGTGRRLAIKPLLTRGDRGKPTPFIVKDLQRVLNLVEDERHLVAYDLYMDCKERMKDLREQKKKHDEEAEAHSPKGKKQSKRGWMGNNSKDKSSGSNFDEKEFESAAALVRKNKEVYSALEKRAPLFYACRDNMDESEGWTLAQTLFGVTTYYRREKDGSLSIKLEGELKGIPLFEQVCVLREIDLHCHWAPFVTSSLTLAHIGKLDTVGWFMLGLPNFGLARDSCFRAVGCDCVEEDGSVLIVGRGVEDRPPDAEVDEGTRHLSEDPELKTLDIPPAPSRMGSGRMTMKMFEAKLTVMAPDHCHTYILANIDPNLAFIPQSLLEFVMKKLCGFLLNKLQAAAKKVARDPVRNVHAQRMRDESAFYRDWLLPKFQNVAAQNGWDMPPLIAFDLTEAQQVEAERLVEKRSGEMHSFSYFDSEGSTDGVESTRSVPNLYHSKALDADDGDDDDDSDISSLSGTSASIWKNNPIATYLREVEQKTQARKDKAAQESRRKAAARLRPRPLPVDKKERLKELKAHKDRKLKSRYSSQASMDGSLPPVDENDTVVTGITQMTGRSVPYSPISAALAGQGRWSRTSIVSGLVLLLFVLLHGDRFLPSFARVEGELMSTVLRDAVTLLYLFVCGVVHFMLCDVELIYAFEAFEMGMKTGDSVKTFYRGKVRLLVAALSGMLVMMSVAKAVLLSWLKAGLVWLLAFYNDNMIKYLYANNDNNPEGVEDGVATDDSGSEMDATIISRVGTSLYYGYSLIMSCSYAVFDWQMRVFVRSNILGRSLESLITGAYNAWVGLLSGIGTSIYSLAHSDDIQDSPGYSWREDAIVTVRVLLTYTAVFLLAVLAFLNLLSKSYRHKPRPDSHDNATRLDHSEDTLASGNTGKLTKRAVGASKSMDSSSAKRRLNFRRKRNAKEDDDSL